MKYWLMKSEPNEFSIHDLKERPNQTEPWDGVRNYQARNFMRDEMKPGDKVLFYHSRTDPSIVGVATIITEGYPDSTAWDPNDHHFDPKSSPEKPIWYRVDIQFERQFLRPLSLKELREVPELSEMILLRKGNRLSVMPVTEKEFETILTIAEDKPSS